MNKVRASSRDIGPLVVISGLLALVYVAFFGRYAFDDSFFGYSIAQSLLAGRGFSFNGGDHVLSTSAPLAVFIYAFISAVFKITIVQGAQVGSAAAYAVIAFGSYALLRSFSSRLGALVGALTLASTPFMLPLWSHETLLYAATTLVGLLLYVHDWRTTSALVLGCATLFRGEALILLPFMWFTEFRSRGTRAAIAFALLSLGPYTAWAIGAWSYFGTPFSETIASKHAQIRYPIYTSYLDGIRDYFVRNYALTPSRIWSYVLSLALLLCALAGLITSPAKRVYTALLVWVTATTALYVFLELPFYFWFCLQLAAGMSASAAMVWHAKPAKRFAPLVELGRFASLVVVAINVAFVVMQLERPGMKFHDDWATMPALENNAYSSLGKWFRHSSNGHATIAFSEFGQLHYYSGHPIIDYLGIVTRGAARHVQADDAIWTFKRYRPKYVVIDTDFVSFLRLTNFADIINPPEYDWFQNAYVPVAKFRFAGGDPRRAHFTVFQLKAADHIPLADERDGGLIVSAVTKTRKGITFEFTPSRNAVELEARLLLPPACHVLHERLVGTRELQSAREIVRERTIRLTMQLLRPLLHARYRWSIQGCAHIAVAPPILPRRGFVWWGKPPPVWGNAFDALTVYDRG